MIGRIVSTKMTKTVTVLIERIAKHPLYKKTYSQSKRYLVDDPIGVKMGDLVEIIKIKPISKNKHWRIIKVVGKNLEEITASVLKAAAEKVIAEVMPEEKPAAESSEGEKKEVVMDNSTEKPKLKKRGRTELSKK